MTDQQATCHDVYCHAFGCQRSVKDRNFRCAGFQAVFGGSISAKGVSALPYEGRVAAAGALQVELWSVVKAMRDGALQRMGEAKAEHDRLDALLKRMAEAGMNSHLPTIGEVQASFAARCSGACGGASADAAQDGAA